MENFRDDSYYQTQAQEFETSTQFIEWAKSTINLKNISTKELYDFYEDMKLAQEDREYSKLQDQKYGY